ncbi:xanthine dehydrogenase family protein molybdopterin-binding subunit [Maribacter cobaltidurans]|uniref:Isoquinoline 1-oxidoreductase n=1 Tax=Maribacter cobaltidurans TaxID=1178778 RepID=A0A223V6S1_9FLAO|nr:molybdopterin cofactor-binding domain-containing protein [Maribacter cobaltidurans]ASV31101.1 isoquinoline 1-oxidoreductase [Maribacter cobaltidurans]GGD95094.1 isoquinoline 1-oxidoreductase subunit beta [Maribacter cobaltidurans]
MTHIKTKLGRRAFIKNTSLAGGGLVLGFSWLNSCKPKGAEAVAMELEMPKEWYEINGYLKIGDNGVVTIMSPNPEIGQNVRTSMPMIVADELEVDWKNVVVEQAPLNTNLYSWQVAGGSRSISSSWQNLRMAGATARHMLKEAAAKAWQVPVEEITAIEGVLSHEASGNSAGYGEMASAAASLEVPEEIELKEIADFSIIGTSRKNVDGKKIVTGQPLFGLDVQREGMLIASLVHPPAFGMKLKSFDAESVKKMPGIHDVFSIKLYDEDYKKNTFHFTAFNELIAVVGESTWQVFQAKKALNAEWENASDITETVTMFGNDMEVTFPAGMEDSETHTTKLKELVTSKGKVTRKDGDPETAFKNAAKIIERSYSCPFLAHNTMEPMNFFAHVTEDHAELLGPTQTPEWMEPAVSEVLGLPLESIDIQMTRQGGGFGRRLYGHFMVETALISKKMKAPVKLVYSREDDMTQGIYRPAYYATYRAALDEDNNLIAFHVKGGGIPESPVFANRFPAGAIDNYLAEDFTLDSNITTGAFRAPRSNFIAGAEQSFLDELAEEMGKDPIDFRLELLKRAQENPVGEKESNDYDAARYAGVLELVKEKANWGQSEAGVHRGVSAYFCHDSYVAQVLDMVMENNKPIVQKVTAAIDCGIVVNPDAASNLSEGGAIDGIGHAMYSGLTFKDGTPEQNNFDRYRLIRHSEAPKSIETHFVKNDIDPTGMGEPPFPPIMGALANALYKATGRRHYHQPFITDKPPLVG